MNRASKMEDNMISIPPEDNTAHCLKTGEHDSRWGSYWPWTAWNVPNGDKSKDTTVMNHIEIIMNNGQIMYLKEYEYIESLKPM